jgi:YVTN family beta-propeller protein
MALILLRFGLYNLLYREFDALKMALSRLSTLVALSALLAGCESSTSPTSRLTHPAGTVTDSVPLPGRPHGVAIAPNDNFCVSEIDGNAIACGTLTKTGISFGPIIAVGQTPAHVALDPAGHFAYTADQTAGTSSIVDVTTGQLVGTVSLGDGGFNVAASSTRTYVTTATGLLVVIDAATRQVIKTLSVGSAANGLALDTLGGMLYVSSRDVGTVTAINTNTNSIIHTYTVGAGAQRVALSLNRGTLYIASEASGAQVLDLASGAVSTIPGVAAGAVGLALSPDGARLYVTNPPNGTLQIVDPASRAVTTLTGLGRPRNVAFNATGTTALVTNEFGKVIVIR